MKDENSGGNAFAEASVLLAFLGVGIIVLLASLDQLVAWFSRLLGVAH